MNRIFALALAACLWVPSVAHAVDFPVSYLVGKVDFRQVVNGDAIAFTLYSDAACTAMVHTQNFTAGSAALLVEKVFPKRVPGQPAASLVRAFRLSATMTPPTLGQQVFLQIAGTGVTPITACVAQSGIPDGTVTDGNVLSFGADDDNDEASSLVEFAVDGTVAATIDANADLDVEGDITFGATPLEVPGSPEALRLLRGQVSSAGAATVGSGFTASRTGAGAYTVTYTAAFSAAAVPTVSIFGGTQPAKAAIITFDANGFTVETYDNLDAAADYAFTFVTMGPR